MHTIELHDESHKHGMTCSAQLPVLKSPTDSPYLGIRLDDAEVLAGTALRGPRRRRRGCNLLSN